MRQKGFSLLIVIASIALLLVGGVFIFKKLGPKTSSYSTGGGTSTSELIDGYPHRCKKEMGFDNYRTFHSLVVDPKDSNTLYVAVEYKGVYKSTDAGKTWVQKNKGLRGYPNKDNQTVPCQEQHPTIKIDPANSKRLLMTSAGSPGRLKDMNSENGGLYESLDGGESWHQLFKEDMSSWTYEALAFDPKNTSTVYVGTTSMPASYDEADPNKIFVTKGIIYKTEDSGASWTELPTGFVKDLRSGKLFVNPNDPKHILFTTMALPANRGGGKASSEQMGILETKDGGKIWTKIESLPKEERAIREAAVAPKNFNNIFVAVSKTDQQESRYFSLDGGKTFEKAEASVGVFSYDPHDEKGLRILGFSAYGVPNDILESLDGGKTWSALGELPKEANNDLRVSNIVFDPNNKDVIYLSGEGGSIWKSQDGGKNWEVVLSLEMLK